MIWTRSRRENKSDQMNSSSSSSLSCELFSDDGSPGDLGQASSGIQATHTSTPTSPTRNSNGIQMPTYKSFAVVGGGRIGLPIVSALASHGASVLLLSWPGSAPKTVPSTVKRWIPPDAVGVRGFWDGIRKPRRELLHLPDQIEDGFG
ncbi:hypothetical protein B0H13DRAFT_1866992 [Mycena leptocephala]|nr:hypothetical protein B0H13DRAFT_1866992 [Mycena leptocephala]